MRCVSSSTVLIHYVLPLCRIVSSLKVTWWVPDEHSCHMSAGVDCSKRCVSCVSVMSARLLECMLLNEMAWINTNWTQNRCLALNFALSALKEELKSFFLFIEGVSTDSPTVKCGNWRAQTEGTISRYVNNKQIASLSPHCSTQNCYLWWN